MLNIIHIVYIFLITLFIILLIKISSIEYIYNKNYIDKIKNKINNNDGLYEYKFIKSIYFLTDENITKILDTCPKPKLIKNLFKSIIKTHMFINSNLESQDDKLQRKIIVNLLKNNLDEYYAIAKQVTEKWYNKLSKKDKKEIYFIKDISNLAYKIIGRKFLGFYNIPDDIDIEHEIHVMAKVINNKVMHPLDYYFNPYKIYNLYKIKKMVLDNSKKLILLNIDDIKKNKECLIHKIALEQVSDKLTFDEALFTRRSLDLGGFFNFIAAENIGSLISTILVEIYMKPKIKSRLLEEIDKYGYEYEDINKSEYLEALINETLRYYTFNPVNMRITNKDFDLKGGKIKSNCPVIIMNKLIHHNPKYYDNPNNFDPNNFINKKISKNAFVPFGYGRRSCAGQYAAKIICKTMVCYIIKNCNIEIDYYPKIELDNLTTNKFDVKYKAKKILK